MLKTWSLLFSLIPLHSRFFHVSITVWKLFLWISSLNIYLLFCKTLPNTNLFCAHKFLNLGTRLRTGDGKQDMRYWRDEIWMQMNYWRWYWRTGLTPYIPGHADGILDIWNMNTNEKFVMECQFYKNKSEALLCYIDKKLVLV